MDEEDVALLQRHEEKCALEQDAKKIEVLAFGCSQNGSDFWHPYPGLRIAFGSSGVAKPLYIIEFLPDGRGWWITLIASRDPKLPAVNGATKVKLSAFQGRDPCCREEYSPRQALLWRTLYTHFKDFK